MVAANRLRFAVGCGEAFHAKERLGVAFLSVASLIVATSFHASSFFADLAVSAWSVVIAIDASVGAADLAALARLVLSAWGCNASALLTDLVRTASFVIAASFDASVVFADLSGFA